MKNAKSVLLLTVLGTTLGITTYAKDKNAIYFTGWYDETSPTTMSLSPGTDCEKSFEICNAALAALGQANEVIPCFIGSRKAVIEMLNQKINDAPFIGSDEEWVEGAWYCGKDSISYKYVDGPNETEETFILNRCTPEFWESNNR